MTIEAETAAPRTDDGKMAALIVYGLYLLSIPSAALFALIGVVVAYIVRGEAQGAWRTHIEDQIRIFWVTVWWAVGLAVLCIPAFILTFVLIGFVMFWAIGIAGFIVMVWFTIKSVLGLLKLLDGQPITSP